MNDGKMRHEMDRRFSVASAAIWVLYQTIGIKREVSQKPKLDLHFNHQPIAVNFR